MLIKLWLGYAVFFMHSPAQAWTYKVHEIISLRNKVNAEYRSILPQETQILKITNLSSNGYDDLNRLLETHNLRAQITFIDNIFDPADHSWLMIQTSSNTSELKSTLSPLVGSDWLEFNQLDKNDRSRIFSSYFNTDHFRDLSYKVRIHLENEGELIPLAKNFSDSEADFAEVYESVKKSFNPADNSVPLEATLPAREQSIVHSTSLIQDANCHGTAFCFGRPATHQVREAETFLNLNLYYEEIKTTAELQYGDHIIFFRRSGLPDHSVIYLDGVYVFNLYGKGIGAPQSILSMNHLTELLNLREDSFKIFRKKMTPIRHIRIPFLGEVLFYYAYTTMRVSSSVLKFCGSLIFQK